MRTSKIIAGILVLSVIGTACVRKTDVIDPTPAAVAGHGGHAVLRITPERREKNIDSCLIYLKYNAVSMPTNGKFDDSLWVAQQDGRPIAEFDSLTAGNYFMYGIGWDTDIVDTILGGASFRIIDTTRNTYDVYLTLQKRP